MCKVAVLEKIKEVKVPSKKTILISGVVAAAVATAITTTILRKKRNLKDPECFDDEVFDNEDDLFEEEESYNPETECFCKNSKKKSIK